MKVFTRLTLLSAIALFLFSAPSFGQSILNPTDSLYTYDVNSPPTAPATGTIGKWVRTKRLSWNTVNWKAYIYNGSPFRLKFPKSYVPGAADGKKYPMFIFFHGVGEAALPAGNLYDNEYQLYHGGDVFEAAVNNGKFDGYVLCMQTTGKGGFWGGAEYQKITEIIDYMVANNKLDQFQVVANGLSAGGQATWEITTTYPTVIASAIPMSSASSNYENPSILNAFKFKPIWLFQGGKDPAPAAFNTRIIRDSIWNAGGNLTYTEYPDLAHATWDRAWTEPNFFPFVNAAYISNPWAIFGRTAFCPGDVINTTLGLSPGFTSYQWRKDGVIIPGANSSTLQVTQTGKYDAQVLKGTTWSEWSRIPVTISIKTPTVSPVITAGNASNVLPALDGATSVKLQVPDGYVTYLWQKVGNATTLSTTSSLTVSVPADYKVKVTEKFGCSSDFSTPFTVVNAAGPNKPDPASSLFATTLTQTSIRLDWSANPSPLYPQTKFELYQSLQPGGPYSYIGSVAKDIITYTVTGLLPNTKYFYIVRAVNNTGAAAPSNEASAKTVADVQAPTAPVLSVTGTTRNSIAISWAPSTDNVGVVKYKIFVNGNASYITTGTQFVISGLQNGGRYNITVVAIDLAGNVSPLSNQVTATALLNGLNYKYYTFTGTWNTIPDLNALTPLATGVLPNVSLKPATQATNYAFLFEGYINIPFDGNYTFKTNSDDGSNLYIGTLGGVNSPYTVSTTPTVNNDGLHGPQDKTSAVLNLKKGTYPFAYSYYQQGGGASIALSWITPVSNGAYVAIPDSAFGDAHPVNTSRPAKPTNLAATGTDYNKIKLTWTRNSTNESGFEIWRSLSPASNFVTVGTAPAGAVTYTDTALNPNTQYYYRIRAIGVTGESDFDLAGQGVDYLYYEKSGLTAVPDFSTLTPVTANQSNHVKNFVLGMANVTTNYAIKYSGTINIPSTGMYTFYTSSDDGSILYLDGYDAAHIVVNNDGGHVLQEKSGSKALSSGPHSIYLGYYQGTGGFGLSVSVSATGLQKQLIPDSWLGTTFVSAITLAAPIAPKVPINLAATATSKSTIRLSWTNQATNETAIELYRASAATSNYILYATLAPHTTSYIDTGLFANATYYYKLRALGTVKNSPFSNISSAKTFNVNPVIKKVPDQSVHFGTTKSIKLSATDANGDALTFSANNLPAFAQLVNNGNGTALLNLNPSNADNNSTSQIKIIVQDTYGGADSTQFTLSVNSNYDPVINAVSDYTMGENDVVTIPLTATDQNATDVLTWSVNSLPNSFTLTPGTNGNASLVLHPNYAAAGNYTGQINVNDGNGGYATTQFNITVGNKKPSSAIYIRIKDTSNIGAPWNSVTGQISTAFKDEDGTTTGVGLSFPPDVWHVSNWDQGVTIPTNGVYPPAVIRDFLYFGTEWNNTTLDVTLNGLDTSKRYNITFYGGVVWNARAADNGTTNYSVGGKTASLYVQNNTQNTTSLSNLQPATDGTIVVHMTKGVNTPVAGYLNALVVKPLFDDRTLPIAPASLSAKNIGAKGVQLNWLDQSYNESNFEVYRSASASGPFNLVGTANGDDVTYTDNTAVGNSVYYYKVRAVNYLGGSDYTNTVTITTADRSPKVNAIADVVLKNNGTATVNITTVFDPTDNITLSAKGLPPFATFTDNKNGTGTINIKPTLGSIGIYNGITITATDNYDSTGSTSFNITIQDKDVNSVYINFTDGSGFAPAPWNNMGSSPSAGYTNPNTITDESGAPSGISLKFVEGFTGSAALGMRPKTEQALYPEIISRTGLFDNTTVTKHITVQGLKAGYKYNFVFFNSRDDGFDYTTNFSVTGTTTSATVTSNASYNINRTVQVNGVVPDATGTATINITKGANATNAVISSIIIQSYSVGSIPILSPSDLRVTDTKRTTVTLRWQDRADNENGFEIWRANAGSSSYALVSTVGAGVTTYTDRNLVPNSAYYYIVRAKTSGSVYSSYSNIAFANTAAYTIYINATTTDYQSPAPWNNLNADPVPGLVWSNFLDEQNATTSVGMFEENEWAGTAKGGMAIPNNSGPFPNNVMYAGYILFQGQNAIMKMTGLNIGMAYDFTFFNSSTNSGDLNTLYTINGKQALLNASVNDSGTLTIANIMPDEFGTIEIQIAPGTDFSQFGLLNAMIIQAHAPNTFSVVLPPAGSISQLSARVITEQDVTGTHAVTAYPNPFNQSFILSVAAEENDKLGVSVYDLGGKLVYKGLYANLSHGINTFTINTDKTLTPGVYLIRTSFINRKEDKVIKLIKK